MMMHDKVVLERITLERRCVFCGDGIWLSCMLVKFINDAFQRIQIEYLSVKIFT